MYDNNYKRSCLKVFKALICCIFLFILHPKIISADGCMVPEAVYVEVSRHVLGRCYIEAELVLDRFISDYPDEPAGALLKAAVLQYECADYEDFSRAEEFFKLIEISKQLALKKLRENSSDLWAMYYLSSGDGLKGIWTVGSGDFLKGILKGRSGAKRMSKIIKRDASFYDAYLMLGGYRFWKSVAIDPISWIPFIDSDPENAIAEVENAISHGRLVSPLSNIVLMEIFLEHDTHRAVVLGKNLLEKYPMCRLFAWQLGEAYKKLEMYDEAVCIFSTIAKSYNQEKRDDGSGQLRCWWKLAILSKSIGKRKECLYFCNKVIELGEQTSVKERQQKRIGTARQMIKELTD